MHDFVLSEIGRETFSRGIAARDEFHDKALAPSDVAEMNYYLTSHEVVNAIMSTVESAFSAKNSRATIWVHDYGPGVADDDLTRIFQPFCRVDVLATVRLAALGSGSPSPAVRSRFITDECGWKTRVSGLVVFVEVPISGGAPKLLIARETFPVPLQNLRTPVVSFAT
jgi:hypothetical protein